jgi:ATP/maltotriose-dependent transcriptional regulator MalT
MVAFQALPTEDRSFRQKGVVFFAVMAGSLGKYHLSLDLLGRLFLEGTDPSLLVPALVQAGVCWSQLGSGEVALAYLERAEKHVAADDSKGRAWVFHLKASTLTKLGQGEEAKAALAQAIGAYRKAGDAFGEGTALAVRGSIFLSQGEFKGALDAAREARSHAEKHGFKRLVCLRMIDEGRALLHLGEVENSVSVLREALGEAVTEGDRHAEFHAHHALWKAYAARGQSDQAAVELAAAKSCVPFVDEASDEAREIRSLPLSHERRRRGRPVGRRLAARR